MEKYTIGELCDVVKGKVPIMKSVEGEYPLVVTAEERKTHNVWQFDCEAVCVPLVSSTGHGHASIHRIHYQEGKFSLGNILAAIIPKDEQVLNAEYLYIYLSLMKDEILVPLMKGTANVSLTVNSIKSASILVPDLQEQNYIVENINKISNYRISLIQHISNQEIGIASFRKSFLQQAFQGKLTSQDSLDKPVSLLLEKITNQKKQLIEKKLIKKAMPLPIITDEEKPFELPKGWKWVRLEDISQYIQRGKSPKYVEKSKVPVISQKCVQWSGFDIQKARFIDEDSLDSYKQERFIEYDDLLWNSTGLGTLGRINIFDLKEHLYDKIVSDSHVTVIRVFKEFISAKYVYYWFASPYVQNEINDKATGSTKQTELGTGTIKSYIVPLPPLEEQVRIVEKVNQLMVLCDELEANIEQSKQESENLMKSVLQEAFIVKEEAIVE